MLGLLLAPPLLATLACPGPREVRLEELLPDTGGVRIEGEASEVLGYVHAGVPSGPELLRELGLTRALSGQPGARLALALPPESSEREGRPCRARLAALAAVLEEAMSERGGLPSSLPAHPPCPLGGETRWETAGDRYLLSCQGGHPPERYDSERGLLPAPNPPAPSPVQAALGPGLPEPMTARSVQAVPREGAILLSRPGASAFEPAPAHRLEAPPEAPLRMALGGEQASRLLPAPLAPLVARAARVQAWGDPSQGRWSLRLPPPAGAEADPSPTPGLAPLLEALPPGASGLVAEPTFLARVWPTPCQALALEHPGRPELLALALPSPCPTDGWEPVMVRALRGQAPSLLLASGEADPRWWTESSIAGASQAEESPALPGLVQTLDTAGWRRTVGSPDWTGPSNPSPPQGPEPARAAGWWTLQDRHGAVHRTAWSAGWGTQGAWLEVQRTPSPDPTPAPTPACPTMTAR